PAPARGSGTCPPRPPLPCIRRLRHRRSARAHFRRPPGPAGIASRGGSMTPAPAQSHAFDSLADQYDSLFTNSVIGRAQRNAVWSLAQRVFGPGSRILELSCGSGEDALFLARGGMSVLACDISPRMIAVATARARAELPQAQVRFRVLANERL